jgi:hypothetical protein
VFFFRVFFSKKRLLPWLEMGRNSPLQAKLIQLLQQITISGQWSIIIAGLGPLRSLMGLDILGQWVFVRLHSS